LAWFNPSILAEERCRTELNKAFKERWKIEDSETYELVHERHSEKEEEKKKEHNFVVWIDCQFDVDWFFDGNLTQEANELTTQAEAVQARRCKHLPLDQILELKRLVGHAVVSALRGSKATTLKLIKEAEHFLKERTVERSRIWTLWSAHSVLLFFVLLGSAALHFLGTKWKMVDATLLTTASAGLLGAYLSVVQNAGKGKWDASAGRLAHVTEVITKLLAGFLTGAVVFALSKSSHAPNSLKALTTDEHSQFILGFIFGFSERLIPRIVTKYAGKDSQND
jgi:hypothetical protein